MKTPLRFSVLSAFCLLCVWGTLAPAQAQTTRFVSTTGTNTNPATATSWATSTTDLQGAINASAANDQVWVSAGTHKPGGNANTDRNISFAMKNGVAIYGGFVGNETLLSQRPVINPVSGQPSSTTLSGEIGIPNNTSDNSYHVISNPENLSLNSTAVLDGFVITGGNADGGSLLFDRGGAVFNVGSNPTLTNCSFINNQATFNGGAVSNLGGNPTLTNCSFQSNTATAGGAIANISGSHHVLTNCSFQSNTANDGGAIHNGGGDLMLTNCRFVSNTANEGGAIVNNGGGNSTLSNCSFQSNTANQGGAIYSFSGNPTLTNCSFQSNMANGGGVIHSENGNPRLTNCSFLSNSRIFYNNQSSPILTNCSFLGNSGVMDNGQSCNPTLTNCVLWNNGGAFSNYQIAPFGSTVTITYSLFEPASVAVGGMDISGPGNLTATTSPFVSPTSVVLAVGSPAIDAGLSLASGLAGITTDLVGNPRVVGCRVDMGAVEEQIFTKVPTVIITLPNGSTVSVAGNLPTLTLPPNGNSVLQVSGGSFYERVIIVDRINGYEIRQNDQNTTGIFTINRTGLFTLTVTGANGCSRTVQGVVVAP